MTLPIHYCDLCRRQLAPLAQMVAERNQARHAAPDRPRVYPAIVAGVAWWAAFLVGLAALIDWLVR